MRTLTTALVSVSTAAGIVIASAGNISAIASPTYVCPSNISASATVVTGSSCYALFTTLSTWTEAQAACRVIGGTLAIIRNETQNTAVHSILSATEGWIGGADDDSLIPGSSEGEHFWDGDTRNFWTGGQGGSAVGGSYANWNTGTDEPNDAAAGEDCVQMYANGMWNDYDCEDPKTYVCQLYASEDQSSSTASVGNGGGIRPHSLQQRIQDSLKRFGSPTRSVSPLPTSSNAQGGGGGGTSKDRICARVLRLFGDNPKMLAKVNARLMRSLKFECK